MNFWTSSDWSVQRSHVRKAPSSFTVGTVDEDGSVLLTLAVAGRKARRARHRCLKPGVHRLHRSIRDMPTHPTIKAIVDGPANMHLPANKVAVPTPLILMMWWREEDHFPTQDATSYYGTLPVPYRTFLMYKVSFTNDPSISRVFR